MKIEDLKPDSKKVNITVKVVLKEKPREVASREGHSTHKVTDALVGDETGVVLLSLWDGRIELARPGKSYEITNGYATVFKGSLRLNIGEHGKIREHTKDLGPVKRTNNISEKEIEE